MVRTDSFRVRVSQGTPVAVIGCGISGLTTAHFLAKAGYDVTIFESASTLGMDAHSIDFDGFRVDVPVRAISHHYYANLMRLYKYLRLPLAPVNYSFSISVEGESEPFLHYWNFLGIIPIFRLQSLLKGRMWTVAYDVLRYFLTTPAAMRRGELKDISLEVDLHRRGFSKEFLELLLFPVLSTTFSCTFQQVRAYPALNVANYVLSRKTLGFAQWWRVTSGIKSVVSALLQGFPPGKIRTSAEVCDVEPSTVKGGSVKVRLSTGENLLFGAVMLCLEAPKALKMLGNHASPEERALLGTFETCKSEIRIHRDTRVLPLALRQCSTACLTIPAGPITDSTTAQCTILVHKLLNMPSGSLCLQTWNKRLEDGWVHASPPSSFTRSVVTVDSERVVREQLGSIQGSRGVWFCGSYASPGGVTLLEQAVTSALDVVRDFGVDVPFTVQEGGTMGPSFPAVVLSEVVYYRWRVMVPLFLIGAVLGLKKNIAG